MAIASGGTLGTGANSTSNSSYTFNTATNTLAAGDVGLLISVSDNTSTTDGNNNEHTSVTGGTGTWTKIGEHCNSNGAAAAGVVVSLWRFVASGSVPTGTTITISFSGNRTDKCASFWKFTVGGTLLLDTEPGTNPITSDVDASNGFGSSAFSGLSSKQRLYFRALGKEANSTTALTPTASYTITTATRSRNNASAVLARGEFIIATNTGSTSNPTLAVTGDTAGLFAAFVEAATQNLTPTRFDNSQTFYAPSVGKTLSQTAILANANTFYSPVVALDSAQQVRVSWVSVEADGELSLLPPLLTNSQTFYAATVTPGAVDLSPTRLDNAQTFYPHTLTPGAVNLTATRLDNSQTFYAATVSPGAVTLQPGRLDNAQTFYSATVQPGSVSLLLSRLDNTQIFYSPTVSTGQVILSVPRVDNVSVFFAHTVSTGVQEDMSGGVYVLSRAHRRRR